MNLESCRICGCETIDCYQHLPMGHIRVVGWIARCHKCDHAVVHDSEAEVCTAWNADANRISFPMAELTVGEWIPRCDGMKFALFWSNGEQAGLAWKQKGQNGWGFHAYQAYNGPFPASAPHGVKGTSEDSISAMDRCKVQLKRMCIEQRRKLREGK